MSESTATISELVGGQAALQVAQNIGKELLNFTESEIDVLVAREHAATHRLTEQAKTKDTQAKAVQRTMDFVGRYNQMQVIPVSDPTAAPPAFDDEADSALRLAWSVLRAEEDADAHAMSFRTLLALVTNTTAVRFPEKAPMIRTVVGQSLLYFMLRGIVGQERLNSVLTERQRGALVGPLLRARDAAANKPGQNTEGTHVQ